MQSVLVDLVNNKESYTAFDGMQIWSSIYKDNCMVEQFSLDKGKRVDLSKTCSDSTLLYQLVSGLHTSINSHVAFNFLDPISQSPLSSQQEQESFAPSSPSPNYEVFVRTVGMYPERVKNLFFLYSLVIKAVHRAENAYRGVDYSPEELTGS